MARIIVLAGVLAFLAGCAAKEPVNAGATTARPAVPAAEALGRDDPPGTYTQPSFGPERRVEPPPPPRRP